ncbi:MAG: 2-hydroxyacyl-CoA dehydratase [Phycisphaerae bacterium]|nr:2-hydroxyacyl-CoA dehydratase [Phycisphaerae bacterium]
MSQILYTCPFVPAEWIAAHGLRPARIMPQSTGMHAAVAPIEGLCPFARAFANHVLGDSTSCGAIFTTACDQMRRVRDLVVDGTCVETFLLNLPKTWRNAACTQLYIDELGRMGRWLYTLGGCVPSADALAATMLDFDGRRQAMPDRRVADSGGVRLALVGGPLLAGESGLFDLVVRNGGRIVFDATETGERTLPDRFDPALLRQDPVGELARAYFDSIPAVWKRPNTGLFDWLTRECTERRVQGVICRRLVWCDLWHAEVHRLRDALHVPLLDLDVSDDSPAAGERTAGRVQAFLETLQ